MVCSCLNILGRQKIRKGPIPPELESLAHEKRHLMIEKLADADEIIAEMFLVDEEPSLEQLKVEIFIVSKISFHI